MRFFAIAAVFAATAAFGADFTLYNVVPFSPGNEKVAAADAKEYLGRTGNDLVLYSLTLHPEGRPAIDKVRRYVESFRRFKAELAGSDVRAGILVQAILGHWPRVDKDIEDWTRTVDAKGKKVRFCPLDPGFAQYITDTFTLLAKERPAFILTDDDIRAFSHEAECFCERHMKLFNARRGTSYTSDALRAKLKKASQSDPDYVAFLAMQREMIEGVVKRARLAIDAVDPSIPGGICIASEEHLFCAPLARAMAAKGQVPVMRTATAAYLERMTAAAAPRCVCRMMGFGEYYRGSGIELLCEADSWPHNLWSKSARSFLTHLANAAFVGMVGAKIWYVNGHKGPFPVSRNYTDVLAENRGLLPALAEAVSGTEWEGLAIPCFTNFPNWHLVNNHSEFFVATDNAGANVCIPFGIPFQTVRDFDADRVYALSSVAEVARLSDGDLRRMLSHKVVVFRDAAEALSKRGFDALTGVKVERRNLVFNRERDDMHGVELAFSPSSKDKLFTANPSAAVLSTLGYRPFPGSPQYDVVSPATVLFANALGGRVLTVQYHPKMADYQLYSEARRAWLLAALDRLSGEKTFASGHDQDMLTLVRRKAAGEQIVLAENLNPEPIRHLSFRMASEPRNVQRLEGDGTWRTVNAKFDGVKLVCDTTLAFYEAAVLRLVHR
ncbi:MAG: hypothetical protein IKQ17_04290 [Kiritimatiellae bacterium]|nr:hypothetical protein [Kiritimatiellia bacterium]